MELSCSLLMREVNVAVQSKPEILSGYLQFLSAQNGIIPIEKLENLSQFIR